MRGVITDAAARRAPFLERRVLTAWRVLNGRGDGGPPGLTIDRYADWLVVAGREALGAQVIGAWADAAFDALKPAGLVVKSLRPAVRESTSRVVRGVLPESPVRVREDGAVFLCDLDSGVSTGLFLDQHDARPIVRDLSAGAEVLNLFAYTCAFSVQAALGGARRVTSVDVSRRALRRGRENMVASGLDADRHRWFDDDALAHLSRLERRAPAYDLVIADPPVVGRSKKGTFALERGLAALARGCVAALRPGGVLVISTHAVELDVDALFTAVESAARVRGGRVGVLHRLGLPEWDHPSPAPRGLGDGARDHRERAGGRTPVREAEPPWSDVDDRGAYLKTLVLRVG